jgi:hypothetical protein
MTKINFEFKGQTGHWKILSPQYLENFPLEKHQILYPGDTSQGVDDPY